MKFRFFIFLLVSSLCSFAQNDPATQSTQDFIKTVIENIPSNDPTLVLPQFQYESYENIKISGDPEAITGPGYKKTELRKTLKQTQVFFSEKTSNYIFQEQYGLKEQITGAEMPGFKKPVYPIYNIKFQSSSAYQSPYLIFDGQYINTLSEKGLSHYTYAKGTDSIIDGRDVVKIDFMPLNDRNTAALEGNLFIDKETLGVARAVYSRSGDLNVQAIHNFEFQNETGLWFNKERFLSIKKEKDKKELELFGARLQVGIEKEEKKKTTNEDI